MTTCGPRKPQRQSSNANSSITSDLADDIAILHHFAQSPVHNCILTSPNSAVQQTKAVLLETSFTGRADWVPPPPDRGDDDFSYGSSNPCLLGGGGGGNQSISEATTIPLDELKVPPPPRKNVVFDPKRQIITTHNNGKNPRVHSPPNLMPCRGILQSATTANDRKRQRKPLSLSFTEVRTTRTISNASSFDQDAQQQQQQQLRRDNKKVDLIHDDWFGLAPLASPESLSEISSISSRATSLGKLNFNSSLERDFFMASCQEEAVGMSIADAGHNAEKQPTFEDEDQLKTPVIMRRAPKINVDLAKSGSDAAQLEKYKRHGQVFVTPITAAVDMDVVYDEDTDSSSGTGVPFVAASISFSGNSRRPLPAVVFNGGRKPFVEISSSSSSCASSITGGGAGSSSFKMAPTPDDNLLLIDFASTKSAEMLNESCSSTTNREKLNVSADLLLARTAKGRLLPQLERLRRNEASSQSDSAMLESSNYLMAKQQQQPQSRQAKVTVIGSSSDTYHSAASNFDETANYFKQEPITNKMASGVIESHFPLLEEYYYESQLASPSSQDSTTCILDAAPLSTAAFTRHNVSMISSSSPLPLVTATNRVNQQRRAASCSPSSRLGSGNAKATASTTTSGSPSITVMHYDATPTKPSPTHFNKSRKIYPHNSRPRIIHFAHEESNV